MKNKIIYVLIFSLLAGCMVPRNYPAAKRKVDKIVKKWPEVLQNDTIVLRDTFVLDETVLDTFWMPWEVDTFQYYKERLKLKLFYRHDTVKIEASCETDTIFITKKVPIYKIEKKNLKTVNSWAWFWWVLLLIIISIFLLFLWLRKFK